MAITASYGFDGTINEAQWSTLHAPVNQGYVEGMAATVGTGTREVDIASGTAWAVGTYHVASATTVALSANSSGNTRIDTIVVNINFSTDTATVTAVEGTPAGSPVAPTLTQTAGTQWQIPLCHVTVVDGETAFSTADIEDARPHYVTPRYTTNTTIGFSAASGWSLDQCEGVKWGPVRHLLLRVTRTGSTITSSANGNITDEIVGTVASNDWCAPSTLAYVTAQSRNSISSGSCLLYDNGTINIGSLNGDGAEIRPDDFVRVSFTWMHVDFEQTP